MLLPCLSLFVSCHWEPCACSYPLVLRKAPYCPASEACLFPFLHGPVTSSERDAAISGMPAHPAMSSGPPLPAAAGFSNSPAAAGFSTSTPAAGFSNNSPVSSPRINPNHHPTLTPRGGAVPQPPPFAGSPARTSMPFPPSPLSPGHPATYPGASFAQDNGRLPGGMGSQGARRSTKNILYAVMALVSELDDEDLILIKREIESRLAGNR